MVTKRLVVRTPEMVTPIQVVYDDARGDLSLMVFKGNRTSHYAWRPADDNPLSTVYDYIHDHINTIDEYSCISIDKTSSVTGVKDAATFFGPPQPNIDNDPYEDWRKLIQ